MKTNEALDLMDESFLEKMYQYAYRRCNTSLEAEDLCSQIILKCVESIQKGQEISNFYGFVWTIAHRVYADYCEKRNSKCKAVSLGNSELYLSDEENDIELFIEDMTTAEQLQNILYEITFLSKVYRDVMVMYYIDEWKVKDIASKLHISETTVKQRLFSARNEIRKEVDVMKNRNLSLKPMRLAISGTGNPMWSDPRTKAERMLSQNLVYLCKDKPRTAKELSEELGVPMPYIEDELEIQVLGENGEYGMLKRLNNGKYITNVHIVDYKEFDEVNQIFERHLPKICEALKESLVEHEAAILDFPYLSRQDNVHFILWSLISRIVWNMEREVIELVKKKYFADVVPSKRPFSVAAVAFRDEETPRFDFYGCDEIYATEIAGYQEVYISNIYGNRIDAHFHCGHNFSQDPKLIMLAKSIEGLGVDFLKEDEKEVVAKAIECGYVRKKDAIIEPNIIVINKKDMDAMQLLSDQLQENLGDIKQCIAEELGFYMWKHIPKHLINEYEIYSKLIAGVRILSDIIEECIAAGVLTEPKSRQGAEGVVMVVEK